MADIAAEEGLVGTAYVLQAIGFDLEAERANIMEAGLAQFEDFRYLVEKDIRDMADEFGRVLRHLARSSLGSEGPRNCWA
jgi:hypothetical protein